MFANRRDRNVLYEHHLVVRITRKRPDLLFDIDPHSLSQLGIELGDALRRFFEPITFRVLADALKHQPNALFDLLQIDLIFRPFLCHWIYAADARVLRFNSDKASSCTVVNGTLFSIANPRTSSYSG